jgi:phosphate transport system permease protein
MTTIQISPAQKALYRRRNITNAVALTLACAAALFGLAFLGWILWTLIAKGRRRWIRAGCATPSSAAS